MNNNTTIQKDKVLPLSQDYEFLRTEGLKHIENLASDIWTDYNTHDPGITILEALCYAITELGYRCGFDMKDLLHTTDGTLVNGQTLFTAKEILTGNPLTINDYRKLLVDIDGIHNAWMIAGDYCGEPAIFADCKKDELTFSPNLHPLSLSGLYRVLLDLDFDDRFGDLNNGDIIAGNPESTPFKEGEFVFQVKLPAWKNADPEFAGKAATAANIDSLTITQKGDLFVFSLTLKGLSPVEFTASIPKKPAVVPVTLTDVQRMFDPAISADITPDDKKERIAGIFTAYLQKIAKARSIVQSAVTSLHGHRNLGEDFAEVTTVDDEEIAFCFDVDVQPGSDIEKVQAEIFYAIENYLDPSVDFYSLKELLGKNIPVDEIFTGPVLQHGFIDTAQLETTGLRETIHTSDIINLLMDIDGVIAIRNFLMTKYDASGLPVKDFKSLKWCMKITPYHKPLLSTGRSKIILFKNQFPFIAQYDEVRDTILLLHALRSRDKLNGLESDLPVPAGIKRDTESYWPVQYDFPQTYGIGQAGLPSSATPLRVAQQRQLKAYLMFYEQLLADFFSQLTHAHRLFSIDDIKQTYFARFLNDIKGMEDVYNPDPPCKLEDILGVADQDSTVSSKSGWQNLYEPRDLYEDRRNRFLDHLLGRFAESFNDYALLMYRINYEDRTEEKISFSEFSLAKINTLKNYPVISSERSKAYNYFPVKTDPATATPIADPVTGNLLIDPARLWNTPNVSGLEKRISFLTGIGDFSRRFLFCIRNADIVCINRTVSENGMTVSKFFHSFSFTSAEGITMKSPEYPSSLDLMPVQLKAIQFAAGVAGYRFDATRSTLQVVDPSGNVLLLESESTFASSSSAMEVASAIASGFQQGCNDPAGMHLIEHILLRPRNSDFNLMQVCLHGCDCLCETDPYSFRASVVLPSWPGHFDNMDFREYFEDKIREEAPAHLMLKICWLSNDSMRQFEVVYKKWIETLAGFSAEHSAVTTGLFKNANNEMIRLLVSIHSEYPLANLHDCMESKEGSNPVMLGKTVLGTF